MEYAGRTDRELVDLAQRGDKAAFGELAGRYRERSYSQCLKIMRDPEEAEDRVQEAMAKAYEALPRFRREARFSTWLYAIARNACLMHLRRKGVHTIPLDRPVNCGDAAFAPDVPDPSADTGALLMRKELSAVLSRHVEGLTALNRTVFELRLVQGISTEETAQLLGLTAAAVKSRLHAIRVRLREGLAAYLSDGRCPA